MEPTIGRIVHYKITEAQAEDVKRRRVDAYLSGVRREKIGYQMHVGDAPAEGDILPGTVVKVWPDGRVNLSCQLDGNDLLWVRQVRQGDATGQWNWPPRG